MRLTSQFVEGSDERDSYLKPAIATDDPASQTRNLQRTWHGGTAFEFHPAPAVTARWDFSTVRDLRNYGDTSAAGILASRARNTLAGVDVGLERERNMRASIVVAPPVDAWIRPRLALSSTYAMTSDPNAPTVNDPSAGYSLDLSRRFGNTQRATATTVVDFARAAAQQPEGSVVRRLAEAVGSVNVSISRDQLTAFDAAPFDPSMRYQLGFGAVDVFRDIRSVLAASAGAGTQLDASNTLTLPFGAIITQRVQRTETRQWSRRLQLNQSTIDGEQLIYPDVSLRWSGRPLFLGDLVTNVSLTARAVRSRQAFISPPGFAGAPPELRATRISSYPVTFSATTGPGNASLSAAFSRTDQLDSLPGSIGQSSRSDLSAALTESFPLPASWQLRSGLRTRVSYQQSETQSYVSNVAAIGERSRLTSNGRRAFTLNADTDVAENATFSLQASRVVTFDRNFNQRFTQTLLSAVLNIQFFGGALR